MESALMVYAYAVDHLGLKQRISKYARATSVYGSFTNVSMSCVPQKQISITTNKLKPRQSQPRAPDIFAFLKVR